MPRKLNADELACWLENEGIDRKDIKILKGAWTQQLKKIHLLRFFKPLDLGVNERRFLKLNATSDELKDISQATKCQIEDLQEDLRKMSK